ncbi:LacI family DNA-binding transcriptional regulator [Actinoplanes teichomyceticus]|uniref:LacI family transcriptional regulator n=1 Tax=Actinoplanes teichomyceticus TaxID=1867 RepID=A0A561W9Z2_ACTTI|nr:LacI family DNA-binding transcriptional regulator [Actinoplanes teichomyceticus]TWG20671.1 LacI family transcriptional regulator [Actinoplanes teichomyceticus]GIF14326.1 LacI family transcriptional regulator [Actinoplanes teichomyceticus]
MAVTLADVARLAGVSPATVSRVINDSAKKVAPQLRERVLAAVAELHYVPNAHAQNVARPRKSAVGVIVHDVSDPYFAEITRGLQRQAAAHGRLLVICNSYREPERELAYVALLRAQQVHALILAGSGYHDDEFTARLNGELNAYQQGGGRVAVIGRHELVGSAVLPANEAGAYALACRVLRLGHRRIGVIAGPRTLTTTTDRLSGVRRAAAELGVPLPPERIVHADFTRDGGAAAAGELLAAAPDLTAILALNDSMAVGTLATLRERGVAAPQQISVTGFDDMPIARDVTPALSTVRLPLVGMGERAMALALGDEAVPVSEPAPAEVVWRASCVPPAT